MNKSSSVWELPQTDTLMSALLSIGTPDQMKAFLRDIMTEKEVAELANRLKAAGMLIDSEKYIDITETTGLSSRTIARISTCIKSGDEGYRTVINSLDAHHSHIPPARD